MREPPIGLDDAQVLSAVREHWDADVDAVEHLAVGFGAHHWAGSIHGRRAWFVTLDALGARHDLASLSAAYAGAAELFAGGLELVHAGVAPWAVPLGDGALSVTPWLDGDRPGRLDVAATTSALARLHAAEVPDGLSHWRPLVEPGLAADLAVRVATPWTSGPYGERARRAVATRLHDVERWVARYHRLAGSAHDRPWVATHGEPGEHNQLVSAGALRLVDWESLKLAPAERDLRAVGLGEPAMLEMFDLEWRLDEVRQYAAWFAAPHTGTASDDVALAGLLEELERPDA